MMINIGDCDEGGHAAIQAPGPAIGKPLWLVD
jgi:hypothetical protein